MVIEAVLHSVREFGGRILVGVAVVLLLVSVFFVGLSSFDQLIFSASLFLGTVSLILGILAHFELLEEKGILTQAEYEKRVMEKVKIK